jgi:hypothetical protein
VSILRKTHKQHSNKKEGNKNTNTKKRVHFKFSKTSNKRNGTRKKNRKQSPSARQFKIKNRTLTPMPMSSSL